MKKNLFFIVLVSTFIVFGGVSPSAGITLPVSKTGDNLARCVQGNVERTFSRSINSITNYATTIQKNATDVATGTAFKDSINDMQNSVTKIQKNYTDITTGVIKPMNNAYDSVNNSMLENMSAFSQMTEAMKNNKSAKVYFQEAGKKIAVDIGVGKVTNDVFEAIDTIPTYGEMSSAIGIINSGKTIASSSSSSSQSEAVKALKSLNKFEKGVSLLTGDDFSVNDMIKDIDALKDAEKIMNLDKLDLPPSLATIANIAAMKPAIDAFMLMNNVGRVQQVQDFITTLQSIAKLQALQDSAFTTMTTATELSDNLKKLENVMKVFSAEPASIKSVANAAKSAKSVYKDAKSKVGDIKKMAANLKKAVDNVKSVKDGFQKDIAGVEKIFSGSADLGSLLSSLSAFKGLKPTIDSVINYMDVGGKSKDLYKNLMGFGSSAKSTEAIFKASEPYVDTAKIKTKAWEADLKAYFADSKKDNDDIAQKSNEVSKKESTAKKLKAGHKKFKADKAKAEANLDFLAGVYALNLDALTKIDKARTRLTKIAESSQIDKLSSDTLELTEASKDVMKAYKSVSSVNEDKLMKPIESFDKSLDKFKNVENQLKDIDKLADNISKSKQLANGLANNIQNLGGFIKCFDIDVDSILKDTLLRVQDHVVEELREGVWKAYSKTVISVPYLMLPEDTESKFDSPFSNNLNEPKFIDKDIVNNLIKLAGVEIETDIHPLAGQQFAAITTIDDFKYKTPIKVDLKKSSKFDYKDTLGAWKISYLPIPKVNAVGVEWDFGDWSTTAWAPVLGGLECGFNPKNDFCWYWKWKSCGFISKCFKVPYLLPACMTNFDYKEPTVHVEVSPRSATSHLLYMKFLRDLPSGIKDWATGGHEPIPSAHVVGISPQARYMSKIGIDGANLTMICDLAQKMDRFEHIQYYGIPTSPAKAAMEIGKSLVTLKDWKTEWFTDEAGELGLFPASLQALYMTELNKSEWNPRAFPSGETPSGETKPGFEKDREKAYKWALPYLKGASDPTGTVIVENIMMNKCDAGLPSDGTNICVGDWGALFPRNGQVSVEDSRYPLKRFAQLAYRAYDRVLEKDLISSLKVQPGTEKYGVGFDKTEFSLEWPYRTDRMKVGEDPKNWVKGYFGESLNSGGMIMTLWKDTSCCVKACCAYPGTKFKPGESYYFSLPFWEDKEWGITEVSKHR